MRLAWARAGVAILALQLACGSVAAAPASMLIGTGPEAGFALPLGGALCRMVGQETRKPNDCWLLATDGSVENLKLLRAGEINFAIAQSDIVADALTGSGAFNGTPPFSDLRGVAGFYAQALTILVQEGGPVRQVDDLKGKRIAVGEPNLPDPLFSDFLEGLGWSKADLAGTVEMPRSDQIGALCAGTVAAIAVTAPNPNGFVRGALAASCPIAVLDLAGPGLEAVIASHPAYAPVDVDLAAYKAGAKPVHSFGPRAVLVTTAKMDDQRVGRIMAALDTHDEQLRKAHPAFAGLDKATLFSQQGLGAERHDAATKYLVDHKLADPASGE